MDTFERRSEIVRHLQQHQRASTRSLSALFAVSEVTIRHDLNALQRQGWLARIHGGAEIKGRLQAEQPFAVRRQLHAAEKAHIAQAAAGLVLPGDTIMLDGSTTAYQLALHLKELAGLRVVTNNLQVVGVLSSCPEIEVVLLGGVVRRETASIVGPPAEDMLRQLHAAKGFFGAAGLVLDRGLTDPDMREVQVKRAMIKAVDQVYILLDASKFGRQSFLTFATLAEVYRIITDDKAPAEYIQACQEAGVQLSVV